MKSLFAAGLLSLAMGLMAVVGAEKSEETSKAAAAPKTETKPSNNVSTNEVAVIKTSLGEMVLEFWPDVAPKTVENFITLAKKGFYDGTCFHRVIKDFMIQGGDPLTKDNSKAEMWGTGDPGYKIKAEFNKKNHTKGVISMARSRHPDSAGSQFFICHGAPSFLDGQYTCFGKLIKGEDVLDKIATTPCGPGGDGAMSRPRERVNVESIKIVDRDSLGK